MTFTVLPFWSVLGLLGAVAAILGLLQLLRVRPRVVRVVTTLFWIHAVERTQARSLWERFRHPLTYALLLAICALVILALGGPRSGSSERGIREVVILDAGANMTAAESDGTSHLDLAREAVLAEADRLSGADRLAVLVLDPLPRLVHGFDDPPALLGRALEGVAAARTAGSRELAHAAARSLLNGSENGRLVLVTNRPDQAAREGARVVRVGTPCPNAAIVSAMFVPAPVDPLSGRLVARVVYNAAAAGNVGLEVVRGGGAVLLNETVGMTPGTAHDFAVEDLQADGDQLVLRLAAGPGARADDELMLRLPSRHRVRVALSGNLPPALRLGLQSDPAVSIVDAGEVHDLAVRPGGADAQIDRPTLLIDATPPPADAAQSFTYASNQLLLAGLEFAGGRAMAGEGTASALIESGATWLAASVPGKPSRIVLNREFWSEAWALYRQPAFAVFLARAVHQLAGWDAEPIVLTPQRQLEDPLWPQRAMLAGQRVVPAADRFAADLSAAVEPAQPLPSGGRWGRTEIFESLLLLAVGLFLVETYLYTRGRIA